VCIYLVGKLKENKTKRKKEKLSFDNQVLIEFAERWLKISIRGDRRITRSMLKETSSSRRKCITIFF